MAHTAELIAVGTELLLGNVANLDAQILSEGLSALGINVYYHTVVGDNPERLSAALETARRRADIILTTGGLGPTYDDLTKQTICRVFHRELELHQDIVDSLRDMFEHSFHKPMTENNIQQAMLPVGCTVFDNPVGTAPGCAFCEGGVHVLMLPGPPHECEFMFRRHVVPYLRRLSDEIIVSHDLRIFGMGESQVEQILRSRMQSLTNPTLAPYAKPSEMLLRCTAKAASEEEAEAMLSPLMEEVSGILGDVIYGVDVGSLEEVCLALLKEKGLTFACAESCTGGIIAQRITALPGASAVFRGGVVSYWSSVKAGVLGVPQDLLDAHGAVSEPVARAMAQGARTITGAEIGLSVTGVAGPDPDERGTEVGTVFVALSTPDGTWCRPLSYGARRRDRIRGSASNEAYDLLRRYLQGLPLKAN